MKTNANGNDDKGVFKIKEQKLSYFESIHSYAYNLVDKVYETLFAFAQTPGKFEVAGLLEQTLTEKKEADATLTNAAYYFINFDSK